MSRWGLRQLAQPHGNKVIAGRNWFTWDAFDALPEPVRNVINFAPVELGCGRAYDALRAGTPIQAVIRQEVLLARRFVGEHVLLSYGPDHPQAPKAAASAA